MTCSNCSPSEELTDRQREVLATFASLCIEVGPTIRALGEALGVASTNGVADHLRALERKGFIKRRATSKARSPKSESEQPVAETKSESTSLAISNLSVSLLGILFVGLKLTGHIGWSWWWVTAPFWGPAVVGLLFAIGIFAVVLARG